MTAPARTRGFVALCMLAGAERLAFYAWLNPLLVVWVAGLSTTDDAPLGFPLVHRVATGVFGELSGAQLGLKVLGVCNAAFFAALIAGGFVADRWFGARRTSLVGAAVLALGVLLFTTDAAALAALALLVTGCALVRTTVWTQILPIARDRSSQEAAVTLLYLATQVGIFFALIGGTCGSPSLEVCGALADISDWRRQNVPIAGVLVLGSLVVYALRRIPSATTPVLPKQRWRVGGIVVVCALGALFFSIDIQQMYLANDVAVGEVDLRVVPFSDAAVPAYWLGQLPINLITLCIMTPVVVLLWRRQARRGTEPSTSRKLVIGCFLHGVGYLFHLVPALADGPVSGWWVIVSTVVVTVGEIYFAPVALALMMRLVPATFASVAVGIWLVVRELVCDYLAASLFSTRGAFSLATFSLAMFGASMAVTLLAVALRSSFDDGATTTNALPAT